MPQARRSIWWYSLLGTILITYVCVNFAWCSIYRADQPLDIDEAGYFTFPLFAYHAFLSGGIDTWFSQIELPNQQPPITTAMTSFFFALLGPVLNAGYAAECVFGVLALVATFILAKAASSRNDVASLSTILLATAPVFVGESRSYHFTMAATAATTFALLCVIRSNGFSSRTWAVAFGLGLGLMPLSRTVTIALFPAVLVPALLCVVSSKRPSVAFKNLGLAFVACLCVLLTWSLKSWELVKDYLTGFGYGKQSFEYGTTVNPLFDSQAWLGYFARIAQDLYAYHLFSVFVGCAAVAAVVALRRRVRYEKDFMLTHSPIALMSIFFAIGILCLRSSRNVGSFFEAPLFPELLIIASIGWSWLLGRYFRAFMAITLAACTILTITMFKMDAKWNVPLSISVGNIPLIFSDARSHLQSYESAGGFQSSNPNLPISLESGEQWSRALNVISQIIVPFDRPSEPTAFGFNNYVLNMNTLNLASVLRVGRESEDILLDSFVIGDSIAAYEQWLSIGNGKSACRLLTLKGTLSLFQPAVTQKYIESAAIKSGFFIEDEVALPSGAGVVRIWKRVGSCH